MNSINKDIVSRMVSEWEYKPKLAEKTREDLEKMDEEIKVSLNKYLEQNIFPDTPEYFGLSPKVISENFPFKPPAVFLVLDWIKTDPTAALEALVGEFKKPLPKAFDPKALFEFMQSIKKTQKIEPTD